MLNMFMSNDICKNEIKMKSEKNKTLDFYITVLYYYNKFKQF